MYNNMSKVCNNENCKGNPLIVMVTASPTTKSNKCRMKHVVLLLCNGACLINNTKKKPVVGFLARTEIHLLTFLPVRLWIQPCHLPTGHVLKGQGC
jgi:hypothetical protein